FCRQKLNGEIAGAPLTFAGFFQDMEQAMAGTDEAGRVLLERWRQHARALAGKFKGIWRLLKSRCTSDYARRLFSSYCRIKGSTQDSGPAFDFLGAVLLFPGFQRLVVATFGLNGFTSVRVLVLLYLARAFGSGGLCRFAGSCRFALGIQKSDYISGFLAVLLHQILQLFLELEFFLEFVIIGQGVQTRGQVANGIFDLTVFLKHGHLVSPVEYQIVKAMIVYRRAAAQEV